MDMIESNKWSKKLFLNTSTSADQMAEGLLLTAAVCGSWLVRGIPLALNVPLACLRSFLCGKTWKNGKLSNEMMKRGSWVNRPFLIISYRSFAFFLSFSMNEEKD